MAEYASGQISIGGLGNGQDWTEMIDALKKIELRYANQLGRWRDDWNTRLEAFNSLRSSMTEYSTFLKTINSTEKFMSKTAAVSDSTVASITSTEGAIDGSYTLKVGQLATNSFASIKTSVENNLKAITDEATTFKYTYGTGPDMVTRELTIGAGTTLEGLKNIINNDKQNPGVRATVIEAGGEYFLQIYSLEMGENTNINIEANDKYKFDASGWELQVGQNAKVKWNGFPAEADKWYSFRTNNINMYGVGMNLLFEGDAIITVNTDTAKIKENVEKFVEETNKVRSAILAQTTVNSEKKVTDPEYATSQFQMQQGSTLTGNYGVQLISSMFRDTTMSQGKGFEYLTIFDDASFEGDIFSSLAQIGIKTDTVQGSPTFGLLIFEEDETLMTLDKALDLSPQGVAELFAANKTGYADGSDFMVYDTMGGFTKAGKWNITYDIDEDGKIINPAIDGDTSACKVDEDGMILVTKVGHDAAGLRLLVINRQATVANDGTRLADAYSNAARVKDGKVSELITLMDDKFLKAYNEDPLVEKGILSILERQYRTIMNNIEDKIAKEGERLVKWERDLKLRFARLDETLKKYDNLTAAVESQIKQLPGNSSKS